MEELEDLILIKLETARSAWKHFVNGVNRSNGIPPSTKSVLNEETGLYETVPTTEEDHAEWNEAQQQKAYEYLFDHMYKVGTDNAVVHAEVQANKQIRQIADQSKEPIRSVTRFTIEDVV